MGRPGRREATLFVLAASAAFASSGPLSRYARPVHPLAIAFGRVALAVIVLLALDFRTVFMSLRALRARERAVVVAAGILLAAHFALFIWGLDRTSLPAAVTLISLEPLSVVVFAFALHRIRPSRGEQFGVLAATLGAVVVAHGAGTGEHRLDGDLMVVGAAVLYGLYVNSARTLKDALPARAYATLVYAVAALALALALLVLPTGSLGTSWPMPAHSAIAILALALIPTVLGHTAVQAAARVLSPSLVALVPAGETVGGLVISAIALGAVPSAVELAGAVLIVGGVVLTIVGGTFAHEPEGGGAG